MEQGKLLAGALSVGEVCIPRLADDIGCGFDLGKGTLVEGLGLKVILVTTESPTAEIVFFEVFAAITEFFDDGFIGKAIVEHLVNLFPQDRWQTGNFAVAAGFGLQGSVEQIGMTE